MLVVWSLSHTYNIPVMIMEIPKEHYTCEHTGMYTCVYSYAPDTHRDILFFIFESLKNTPIIRRNCEFLSEEKRKIDRDEAEQRVHLMGWAVTGGKSNVVVLSFVFIGVWQMIWLISNTREQKPTLQTAQLGVSTTEHLGWGKPGGKLPCGIVKNNPHRKWVLGPVTHTPAFLSGPITGKKSAQGNPLGRFRINTQVVIEDHWVGWAPLTSTDLSLARNKESTDQTQWAC